MAEEVFENYMFDCPICKRSYHVTDEFDDNEVTLYGECPDCVAAYNAGLRD